MMIWFLAFSLPALYNYWNYNQFHSMFNTDMAFSLAYPFTLNKQLVIKNVCFII